LQEYAIFTVTNSGTITGGNGGVGGLGGAGGTGNDTVITNGAIAGGLSRGFGFTCRPAGGMQQHPFRLVSNVT
jgi:hypothetical protein